MTKKRWTAQFLNCHIDAGKYYDYGGNGLFIHVKTSGAKAWAQRIRYNGKQLELGLGKYPEVSLALARKAATDNKALTAQGINPKVVKEKPMQKDLKPMENGEITHLNKSHHGCQGSNKYEIGFDKSALCARDATD